MHNDITLLSEGMVMMAAQAQMNTRIGEVEGDVASGAVLAEEGAGMAVQLVREAGLHCGSIQEMAYEELREVALEERFAEVEARRV